MKSTETSPSAHVLKKSQPEEFDVMILGGRVRHVSRFLRDVGILVRRLRRKPVASWPTFAVLAKGGE